MSRRRVLEIFAYVNGVLAVANLYCAVGFTGNPLWVRLFNVVCAGVSAYGCYRAILSLRQEPATGDRA
jgi:hypothetical protein